MKIHKNARLTFARRLEMVRAILQEGTRMGTIARMYGVSEPTARKWTARYRTTGATGLEDRPSKPHRSPRATHPSVVAAILELRRAGMNMQAIASSVAASVSTVSRVCATAGMSRLPRLRPAIPVRTEIRATPMASTNEARRGYASPETDG